LAAYSDDPKAQVRARFADLEGIGQGEMVGYGARRTDSSGSDSCRDAGVRHSCGARGSDDVAAADALVDLANAHLDLVRSDAQP
jgi:hypothetical protein